MNTISRVLVLGLDCATPQLVFDQLAPDLPNLSALRRRGVWGELESVIPAITVPAWACSMTSRDPGQLGIYGFRNRIDHSYDNLGMATSASVREPAVWDVLGAQGRNVVLVGVPPSYPPKPVNGVLLSCFLTPGSESQYAHPPGLKPEIERLIGPYPVDVEDFRTDEKDRIAEQAHDMTAKHFTAFRHLLRTRTWDFAMMVEIGPDRMHHAFWQYMDPEHPKHEPGNRYQHVIRDYYRALDEHIGALLADLDDATAVIVMSDHGAKRMLGGVCVNEWLIREGYLTLKSQPDGVAPLSECEVDWSRTKAWGEGGYYARVFVNVQGREPQGTVPAAEYEAFRDELAAKLAAITGESSAPLGTKVFKPEDIYRACRNVPPDLLVYFGDLSWRSVGSVGIGSVLTYENDTGPDDANHAQHGIFIASAPGLSPARRDGLRLLDVGPTVLDLLGVPPPAAMIGAPLLGR